MDETPHACNAGAFAGNNIEVLNTFELTPAQPEKQQLKTAFAERYPILCAHWFREFPVGKSKE